MIKKTLLVATFMLSALFAGAQFYYGGMSGSYHFPRTQFATDSAGNIRFVPGDMGFSLEAGAAYSQFGSKGLFSTYTSPALAYNVSPRFRLRTGVTLFTTFNQPGPEDPAMMFSPYPMEGSRVFVAGDYIVNNKLMLSGAVYKDFTPLNPAFVNDPLLNGKGYEGMMFNINYSPAKNFHINATIEYSNRPSFYHRNPFYNPSPFSPGYGW